MVEPIQAELLMEQSELLEKELLMLRLPSSKLPFSPFADKYRHSAKDGHSNQQICWMLSRASHAEILLAVVGMC